jgi:hypothetical protein
MDRKRRWLMVKIGKLILLAAVFLGAYIIFRIISYYLADHEYEKLVQIKPATRVEVEQVLFLYSAKQIDIKKSMWGKTYQLESGDVCLQYLILWREPIDIVFDKENHVKAIFSSFE